MVMKTAIASGRAGPNRSLARSYICGLAAGAALLLSAASAAEALGGARVPLLSDAEAWKALPSATRGAGQPLPGWARAFARSLPRTTAAMLDLDRIQRTRSPLGPILRGKLRWVAADANRCAYGRATAEADLRRAGLDEAGLKALKGSWEGLPDAERAALAFARDMT